MRGLPPIPTAPPPPVITTRDKLINRIVGVAERPLVSLQYLPPGSKWRLVMRIGNNQVAGELGETHTSVRLWRRKAPRTHN